MFLENLIMNISIISSSHRINSQSFRVSEILSDQLSKKSKSLNVYNFDLNKINLPLWTENFNKDLELLENWKNISKKLISSDAFILVVPEYGGMASPVAKNFFLYCSDGELTHKPGLIVSISSGNGGAYPVSELRSSSYKNRHIMWIPENIIIRNVNQFNPGNQGKLIPEWLEKRIDYVLELLILYGRYMKPIQKIVNRKDFGNGM